MHRRHLPAAKALLIVRTGAAAGWCGSRSPRRDDPDAGRPAGTRGGETMLKVLAKLCVVAAMVCATVELNAPVAMAQAGMSCDELWYARNRIYARNGYCFQTDRARAVFGAGCFPPYGQLSGWEAGRVQEIQMWERRKGC
jgi:hypothetical protein